MRDRFAATLRRDHRYLVLAASMLIFTVGSGGLFILVVNLKPIAEEFLWPRTVPSLAYSLQFFGSGVGGLAMGWWVDRSGIGWPALLGAVMIGSGAMLTSRVSAEWQLYALYGVMMGLLGMATLFAPLMANIVRWFEHRRGLAIGIVSSGQSLAGAIWPPIFRYFSETYGWRTTFFWFGVFALSVMLPLAVVLGRNPPPAPATPPRRSEAGTAGEEAAPPASSRFATGLSAAALQGTLCVAIIGCCIAMAMPGAHLVTYATDLEHSSARAAEMLSVLLATSLVTRIVGVGLLADRFGGLRALFIFSSAQAVTLAAMTAVEGLVGLYLVAALFGLGFGGVIPCYPVIVREYLPVGEIGRRTAVVILFGTIGMALGSWLGGFVFDLTGSYDVVWWLAVALGLAAALVHWPIDERSLRPAEA